MADIFFKPSHEDLADERKKPLKEPQKKNGATDASTHLSVFSEKTR